MFEQFDPTLTVLSNPILSPEWVPDYYTKYLIYKQTHVRK